MNAWVLHPLTRPFLRLDGEERPLGWRRTEDVPVRAGAHCLETFVRYGGLSCAMGTGRLRVVVDEGEAVEVLARNGPLNHQPLQPVERGRSAGPRR